MTLAEELAALTYWVDGTGIRMAFNPNDPINLAKLGPATRAAISAVEALTGLTACRMMVNVIEPGGGSGWHVDPGPRYARWHLAVETNEGCFVDQGNGPEHYPVGEWRGPVKYWEQHRVWNGGTTPRTHLVVDLC